MSHVRLLVLATVVLLLAGCAVPFAPLITGSGSAVTKDFDLAGFTAVAAGSAFEVEITRSDTYGVAVTVNENLVERLDVGVSGDTLRIYLKPGIARNAVLKAKVTMPELTGLNLSGASSTTLTGFNANKSLKGEVSGASTLRGDLTCGNAQFDVSGASKVELQGSAQDLNVRASGASTANFERFNSKNTVVNASGASHVTVAASGSLDVEASGASTVRYTGEPAKLKVNTSGASSVGQK
jgi:hypothetical protein